MLMVPVPVTEPVKVDAMLAPDPSVHEVESMRYPAGTVSEIVIGLAWFVTE